MEHLDHTTSNNTIDDALMPPHVRRVVYGIVAGLLALTAYLFHVRGVAFMFDFADRLISAFCT